MNYEEILKLDIATDRALIGRGETTRLHVVAEISAGERGIDRERPPLSIIFVLDVSSSMVGAPIQQVIRSTERLVALLAPTDRAGVVVFGDRARMIAPLMPLDAEAKRALVHEVRGIVALGSTNMEAGLRLAKEMLPERAQHERLVIVLLSDGGPNVGESSAQGLAQLARAMRPDVSTSTLGYGAQHDERILGAIADAGGGRYHFIPDPELCPLELARAIGAQGDVVAEDVTLVLSPREGVTVERVLRTREARVGAGGLVIPVADLCAGAKRVVAAQISVDVARADPTARRELLGAVLSWRRAGSEARGRLSRAVEIDVGASAGPPAIAQHHRVLVVRADEARDEARSLADRQRFGEAASLLRGLIGELARAPGYVAGDGSALSEACEQLIDDAAMYEKNPSRDEYRAFRRGQRAELAGDGARAGTAEAQSASSRKMADAAAGNYPPARLVAVAGPERGRIFSLGSQNILGRTASADIVMKCSNVSRQHSSIFALEGEFWIACLGSTNGTYVNGQKIGTHKLSQDDVIDLGDYRLRYDEALAGDAVS